MAEKAINPEADLFAAMQKNVERAQALKEEQPIEESQEEEVVAPEAPSQEQEEESNEGLEDQSTEESSEEETQASSEESEPEKPEDTSQEDEASKEVLAEDELISDWDIDGIEEKQDSPPAEVDFTSLASEIGVEAATKEELVQKVSELKAKAEQPDPLSTLPDNFKEAIEIAKQDGDWLEYLGVTSVDYNAYDNAAIVQNHYANILRDAEGNVDMEKVEMMMDSMSEAEIDVKGIELKQGYEAAKQQRAAALKQQAAQERVRADKELKQVLDRLEEYRGFKYTPSHKKQLYDGITSGDMIAQMFHGDDGRMDMKKVVKAYTDYLYGDKQVKYLRQQIATETKKEVLSRLSNKQVEPKAPGLPTPEKKEKLTTQQQMAKDLREGKNPFQPI